MIWPQLHFGHFKGRTLPQVVFIDSDYFFWAHEDGALSGRASMGPENWWSRKGNPHPDPQRT
jgi:hypothetical protein